MRFIGIRAPTAQMENAQFLRWVTLDATDAVPRPLNHIPGQVRQTHVGDSS